MSAPQLLLWSAHAGPVALDDALQQMRQVLAALPAGPERRFAEAKLRECERWAHYAAGTLPKPQVVTR